MNDWKYSKRHKKDLSELCVIIICEERRSGGFRKRPQGFWLVNDSHWSTNQSFKIVLKPRLSQFLWSKQNHSSNTKSTQLQNSRDKNQFLQFSKSCNFRTKQENFRIFNSKFRRYFYPDFLTFKSVRFLCIVKKKYRKKF